MTLVKVLSSTESNLRVGACTCMQVCIHVCVKVSDCIRVLTFVSVCLCVCVCKC